MARFRPNPSLERDLQRSPGVQRVLTTKATDVATEAERNGQQVARSYKATVSDEGEAKRVTARTGGINAAAWIEFGTGGPTPTPAHAPLRRAAETKGVTLRANRR